MLKIFLIVKDERVIWFEVCNIFFFFLGDFFFDLIWFFFILDLEELFIFFFKGVFI